MKDSIKEHIKVFGCFIGLFILRFYISRFVKTFIQHHSAIDYVLAVFTMVLFTAIVFVLYIRWVGWDTFRLKGISWKIWFWTFLLCMSQCFFIWTIYGYPVWIENYYMSEGITDFNYVAYIISGFNGIFCFSVINAILFRGLLQKQSSKILAPWLSISIITILLIVLNFKTIAFIPQVFLSGIFVGIIYHKTDKLILCILYSSFFSFIWNTTRTSFDRSFSWVFFIISIAFAAYAIRGFIKYKPQNNELSTNQQIN